MSLSGFSQSSMTKDGQPSTVTTVRLVGGFCGGRVGSSLLPTSSWGKCSRELVMEQGTSSSFFMYLTWGAKNNRNKLLFNRVNYKKGQCHFTWCPTSIPGRQAEVCISETQSFQNKPHIFNIKLPVLIFVCLFWILCFCSCFLVFAFF